MPIVNGTWTAYNMPNLTNFYDMFTYANYSSGYMFGSLMVVAVFVIAFISSKNQPTEVSVSFAGWIATIISVLMRILLLVPDSIVIGFILVTSFATLMLVRREMNW